MAPVKPLTDPKTPPVQGIDVLLDPRTNKGSAFTLAEREALGITGLVPTGVVSADEQLVQAIEIVRRAGSPLQRYFALSALRDRNEGLYFRLLHTHLTELMPIVYTPTIGEVCEQFGRLQTRPRGLFIGIQHRGRIREVLSNWPHRDVRVIVVTDGERILGLGDLGVHGMGIPIGKLELYSVCAGIDPAWTLPITLDVGTNREDLRDDPLYLGARHPRILGAEYEAFLDEFVDAVRDVFVGALLQFEDFANRNAFALLERHRERMCCFNDDIQGTAAVAMAGILSSVRITGRPLDQQTLLFFGAGAAGIGIADLVVDELCDMGLDPKEARERCWFVDSQGLIVRTRTDLTPQKRRYAHDFAFTPDLLTAIQRLRPTALIGVSGQPRAFTRGIVEAMSEHNERPLVMALSNPTSKAECTAIDAYGFSAGRALFASGSPFDPVALDGRVHVPGQCNNAFVFPGIGLGVIASGARRVRDGVFLAAARALAAQTSATDLGTGSLYPQIARLREVSAHVAAAVADFAFGHELTARVRPSDLLAYVRGFMGKLPPVT